MRSATSLFRTRSLLGLVIVAMMLTVIAAGRMTYRHFRISREIDRVEAEIAALEKERQKLEETRASLNDIAAVERAARELLNLKREGEHVVILLPSSDAAPVEGSEHAALPKSEEPSNPVKWWSYFFGK